MSKATNRTRAFIYDVYAKCEANEQFSFSKLIKHHQLGWMAYEALKRSGRVYMTKPYKWVGFEPTEDVIREIENKRIEIQHEHNQKYNPKLVTTETKAATNVTNIYDLIEQNEKLIQFIKNLQS